MVLPLLQSWETATSQKLEETLARVICKSNNPILGINMTLCQFREKLWLATIPHKALDILSSRQHLGKESQTLVQEASLGSRQVCNDWEVWNCFPSGSSSR